MLNRSGRAAALVSLVAACGGPSTPAPEPISGNSEPPPRAAGAVPTCEELVDHLIEHFPKLHRGNIDDDARARSVADCEQESLSDGFKRCVIAAQQETELGTCIAKYKGGRGGTLGG